MQDCLSRWGRCFRNRRATCKRQPPKVHGDWLEPTQRNIRANRVNKLAQDLHRQDKSPDDKTYNWEVIKWVFRTNS